MEHNMLVDGDFSNCQGRYAIVLTRWNGFVVEKLKEGAIETLKKYGISDGDIGIYYVPGAVEVPLAALKLAQSKRYDGIVTLGAVIRGGTPHFEYVAGECAHGISQASLQTGIPIAFGVLTVDSVEQAEARAGGSEGNKGGEAAESTLEMVSLLRKIDGEK